MASDVRNGIPAPGWSDRVNDPEILAGLARNRKAAFVWTCIGMALAFAIPAAVSMFVENSISMGDALKLGGLIAGIMCVCTLFSWLSKALKKPYEGEVIDKREELRRSGSRKDGDSSYSTEYVTYVRKSDGGKTKIKESHTFAYSAWEYLKVGDRFRCHPKFGFPYELYDKSKTEHLFCPVCVKQNPVEADRCSRCHAPLLK